MSRELKNYKTSLCWHFMNKGHCSLFDKCYFAHGQKELRHKADPLPPVLPPQFTPVSIYKTQLCKVILPACSTICKGIVVTIPVVLSRMDLEICTGC